MESLERAWRKLVFAVFAAALERRKRHALAVARAIRPRRELFRARSDGIVPSGLGHHFVDEAPVDGLLAAHALLGGAEDVREVAPHLALVGQSREPAGAGQDREQRRLRQRDGRAPVVHQHDVVGRKRQLVAAPRAAAVDRRKVDLARMVAGVLDGEPGLVGELAEIDFMAVARPAQHADVGTGAEHVVLAGLDHHGAHFRMLEAQPLHRIVELDVDRQIVGIELELVVAGKPAGRIDVHDQERDLAVDVDLPVPIAGGLGAEIDRLHGLPRTRSPTCIILHIPKKFRVFMK